MVTQVTRIIITAGGTGGHVFPALAVARYLDEHHVQVLWVGTRNGMEAKLVPNAGFDIRYIDISGLRGKGMMRWLSMPFNLVIAIYQSMQVIRDFKPGAILGMGGFASGPCGIAGWLMRVPLFIQEQNAIAGMTNRMLAKVATKVMQAFPNTFAQQNKVVTTGNPVRKEILSLQNPEQRYQQHNDALRLLVVGGSLGALALNETVPAALAQMQASQRPLVWHQAGAGKYESTVALYNELGIKANITEFIDDIAHAYDWADLVICRAGALTVSELAAAGVASILVPFPHAVDDHQTANAHYLSDHAAAVLMAQKNMSTKILAETLTGLCNAGRSKLMKMASAAKQLGCPDATQHVAEICCGVNHG